jgi:D-glycero-alpha-D-manno-heptose-7-phosphate kinase
MIITKTPFRISFFGGGTDYPSWFSENSGQVLSTTFDKYCYISCRKLPPFFPHKFRIVYSKIEVATDPWEIEHPSVKAVLTWLRINQGLEIHHDGDLPARSGLGSSSSFTVGLLHSIAAINGRLISKQDLAKDAIHIEQNIIGENVGSQDQVATAFGGFNHLKFNKDGTFNVNPVVISQARLESLQQHLMLFFSGVSRIASEVAESTINNMTLRIPQLRRMDSLVLDALEILQSEKTSITEFGKLLGEGWELKKQLSDSVSTDVVDEIYNQAIKSGAIGGKLLGAGGGGFLLLFVEPNRQNQVKKALNSFVHVPFRFETAGSQIALYQPEGF